MCAAQKLAVAFCPRRADDRGVAVEFLTDEHSAGYGRFEGEPSRADLEPFFFLDDADRELVGRWRGAYSQLGFTVQLSTVRFLGTFLSPDPLDVPWNVVDYLGGQLPARV